MLLCTDLHGDNILAAQRESWLAIDPKPYLGDPAYDTLQHMLNCEGRLAAHPAGSPPGWPASPAQIPAGYDTGCSPAASRSQPARRSCAR